MREVAASAGRVPARGHLSRSTVSGSRRIEARTGLLLVLPAVIVLTGTTIVPALTLVPLSLTDYNGLSSPSWVGLDNYGSIVSSPTSIRVLQNTAFYAVMYVLPNLSLALFLAVLLTGRIRGAGVYRTLYFLPVVVSITSVSLIGLFLLDPRAGLVNATFSALGLPGQNWLGSPTLALPAIVLISVWQFVGYNVVIFMAGLQSVPVELNEAAEIDGASPRQRFMHVTLPLIRPITFFALVSTTVLALQVFAPVLLLTNGGPGRAGSATAVHEIYNVAFRQFDFGASSALAVLLFVGIALVTTVNFRFLTGRSEIGD